MSSMTWELLDKFLAQQCTSTERMHVERWLTEVPQRASQTALLADAVVPAWTTLRMDARARVLRVVTAPALTPGKRFQLQRNPVGRNLLKTGVLVLTGLAVGVVATHSVLSREQFTAVASGIRVLTTPPGQRASLRLPDGSRVILGVASTLRHYSDFGTGKREVELEGEAYFDVAHTDENTGFVVRARDLVAEDIGTEFIVRAYPEDSTPEVIVRDGRVALRQAGTHASEASHVLLAGQLGRLTPDGRAQVEQADTSAFFAWTQGWLVFDSLPFRAAIPRLNRWYDIDIRLADTALGALPLTATFRNQPTVEALDLLAASLGMRQVRQGRVITLHPVPSDR